MNGPGGNTAQPSTGSSANATRSLTSSAANNATGTGAAGKKYGGSGKMAIIALCGVIAVLALAA